MKPLHIIAEAAQGYEGSCDIGRLLVRAAAAAGADAVKMQVVFADDLAVPGYQYYDLFRTLEMPLASWKAIREEARSRGIAFYVDVLGPRAAELAAELNADGAKIHSTCFFEDSLIKPLLDTMPRVFLSLGGIKPDELSDLVRRYGLAGSDKVSILYGFQAEPTPLEANNLARIPTLRALTDIDVGFMDHVDGGGAHAVTLSAMALALGVSTFEKHITLDRSLELEDYVSGLAPSAFADYVTSLRALAPALGSPDLDLGEPEQAYRQRSLKRVVAARDLAAGTALTAADVLLLRPAQPNEAALLRPGDAIGRRLRQAVAKDTPITPEVLS